MQIRRRIIARTIIQIITTAFSTLLNERRNLGKLHLNCGRFCRRLMNAFVLSCDLCVEVYCYMRSAMQSSISMGIRSPVLQTSICGLWQMLKKFLSCFYEFRMCLNAHQNTKSEQHCHHGCAAIANQWKRNPNYR
jgi:hypothetical protein